MHSQPIQSDEDDELPLLPLLCCRYDDEANPSELTVYPGSDGQPTTTEWLTATVDSTVSLDDAR